MRMLRHHRAGFAPATPHDGRTTGRVALVASAAALAAMLASCSSGSESNDQASSTSAQVSTSASGAGETTSTRQGGSSTTGSAAPSTSATTGSTATSPSSTTAGQSGQSGEVGTGATKVTVPSTTEQYFVLYVKPDLAGTAEVPVAIARGKAGTTTLTDGRTALPAAHYRVATFSVAQPGDVDGDGADDLTELADPATANPLNPAPKMAKETGAVLVADRATWELLSYQGDQVMIDRHLTGLEFVKFYLVGTDTASPKVYYMNTDTYRAHPQFASAVGIPGGRGPAPGNMRGEIVYLPDETAPDGTKGVYRFEFEPNDAYPFKDVVRGYELLASGMPFLTNNLVYYPMPSAALPLYNKEKALYDAYRMPVLVD